MQHLALWEQQMTADRKIRHVSRSTGANNRFRLRLVEEIIEQKMKIEAMIESKTVFNIVEKEVKATERRQKIDIMDLRLSYDDGELQRIARIP